MIMDAFQKLRTFVAKEVGSENQQSDRLLSAFRMRLSTTEQIQEEALFNREIDLFLNKQKSSGNVYSEKAISDFREKALAEWQQNKGKVDSAAADTVQPKQERVSQKGATRRESLEETAENIFRGLSGDKLKKLPHEPYPFDTINSMDEIPQEEKYPATIYCKVLYNDRKFFNFAQSGKSLLARQRAITLFTDAQKLGLQLSEKSVLRIADYAYDRSVKVKNDAH